MTAKILYFPKVHRNGKSPKLADLKREVATDKIKALMAVRWRK